MLNKLGESVPPLYLFLDVMVGTFWGSKFHVKIVKNKVRILIGFILRNLYNIRLAICLSHALGSMFSTDICVLKTSSLRRASLKGLSCRNFSADSQLISFRRTAFHHFFKKLPSHVRNREKGNDFWQNPIGPVWPSRLILSGRGSLFSRLIHSPPSLCLVKEQH